MLNEEERGFIGNVEQQLLFAKKKFPDSFGCMCALTEEVGELAKALMDEPSNNVYKEAVQVATMAMRVALEGDYSLDSVRTIRGANKHPSIGDRNESRSI